MGPSASNCIKSKHRQIIFCDKTFSQKLELAEARRSAEFVFSRAKLQPKSGWNKQVGKKSLKFSTANKEGYYL
jgi:hypothetical protein